jgi:hypothetical protein
MSELSQEPKPTEKITVCGVTFSAAEVVSAVVKIDGRKIEIKEKDEEEKKLGFHH